MTFLANMRLYYRNQFKANGFISYRIINGCSHSVLPRSPVEGLGAVLFYRTEP